MHSNIDHGQSGETTVRINDFLTSGGLVKTETSQNGYFTYYHDQKAQEIFVTYVKSHTPGYGTEAMRRIIQISIDQGCPFKVRLEAAWSSHLFWLLMGMIPLTESTMPYLNLGYGYRVIKDLEFFSKESNEDFLREEEHDEYVKNIKRVFCEQTGTPEEKASLEAIIEKRDFLSGLLDKRVSYLSGSIIPNLLWILNRHLKSTSSEKYPSTVSLQAKIMVLSKEGMERWSEDLAGKKPFSPFSDLAQLLPYATRKHERDELESILPKLASRVATLRKKEGDKTQEVKGVSFFTDQPASPSGPKAPPNKSP